MSDYEAASAFLKAEQIRAQAEHLKLLPFPSPKAENFASLISKACDKLKVLIIRLSRRPSSGEVRRIISFISLFLVDQLAPALRFIEGASSENTPANLVVPLEKIGEVLLPDAKFLVRRQWRYNYRVRELRQTFEQDLERLLPRTDFEAVFAGRSEKLYAISFPSFERDNALLHVNFAHEIGHPLEDRYLTQDPQNTGPLAELPAEIDRLNPKADRIERAKDIGRATSYWRAAIAEVISDTISAWVFGPSALFALSEVADLSHSMDEISRDLHPPWRFRLRHMLSELEGRGFVDAESHKLHGWPEEPPSVLAHVKPKIDEWLVELHAKVSERKDVETIEKNVAAKCAYELVDRATQTIRTFAAQTVGDKAYTRELFHNEVPWLLERLHYDLPPNQIERTLTDVRQVKLASILASGWLYKLTKLHSIFGADADEYAERVQMLNRLILKALELSVVAAEYEQRPMEAGRGVAK